MNNPPREVPATPTDLSELASELRLLWHGIVDGIAWPADLRGLRRQQFWVLAAVAERPRRMAEIAECTQTSQTSLTGIIDRLEEQRLVRRVRSQGDRRVVEVAVTGEGTSVLATAHAAFLARLEDVVEPLSEQERAEFLRLVRKMAHR